MEKRTTIRIERDPGIVARMTDVARSIFGKTRQHRFDGYINSRGYNLGESTREQHNRPVRLRVEAHDNGTIPTHAYEHLVSALKLCREMPVRHPILVEYRSNLNITEYDLKYRVGGMEFIRRAA